MKILETPRLLLREFETGDAKHLFHLNTDREVIKYTGDVPYESIEAAEKIIRKYRPYKEHGYGRWAVILKESNEFIGWCGLKYEEELKDNDIGFRFSKKNWNKGYAAEAAKACIEYGFKKLNLRRIVGRAMKENVASIKVMEKCGMKFVKEMEFKLHAGVLYEILRQ